MPKDFTIVLVVGLSIVCLTVLLQGVWKKVPVWKSIVVILFLMLTWILGGHLMYFVENGSFNGRSLYGAIFLAAIACAPLAKLLKIPFSILSDMCASPGCIMLAGMRVKCYMDDCCGGMMLYKDAEGVAVYFPNQLVEMGIGLILMALFLMMFRKEKFQGTIYGWFLLLYGSARFVLNFFRWNLKPFLWIIPAGTLWSVIAVIIGVIWLRYARKKQNA